MRATLEICVDAPDDLFAAFAAGADRIELCSALALGGLTPSAGLIEQARQCSVPVYAMIRPRGGSFCYSEAEICQMEHDIATMHAAGLAGVVFGALTHDGPPDVATLQRLINAAQGLGLTLHRAVDLLSDPVTAVEPAKALGFERILTSGGASTAPEGARTIARMIAAAGPDIEIMAGSGVTAASVPALHAAGVRSFHASCSQTDADGTRSLNHQVLRELRRAVTRLDR